MPPPSSYIDITSFPFSRTVTQAEFNGGTYGNAANEVWFRRVTTDIEAVGNFTDKGGTFTPRIVLYESDGSTVIKTISGAGGHSHGWYHIFAAGSTHWVKIIRQGAGASDFDFTADFDQDLNVDTLEFTDGDLIIEDLRAGYPAVIYGLDGTRRGFISSFPAGQTGAIIHSNRTLWHDLAGTFSPSGYLHLFYGDLTYAAAINGGLTASQAAPMSNSETDFYVVDQITRAVSKIGPTGIVTSLGTVGSSGQVCAIGVNADGTILYWCHESGASSGVIHRYDLTTQLALSDLYSIAGYDTSNDALARTDNLNPGDILVLPDESIATWWYDASADQYTILHISDAGVLLDSKSLTATDQRMDHLAYIRGSSTQVIVWFFIDEFDTTVRGGILTLSTGVISSSFDNDVFDFGINLTDDDPVMFGPANSCTVVQLRAAAGGEGPATPSSNAIICLHGSVGAITKAGSYTRTLSGHKGSRGVISLTGSV